MKVIRPDLLELQARRNGITRVEVAQALETSFEGRVVGFYREPGGAGTGVYPQETRLPADRRPPAAGRARGRLGDQQPADLEPGRRADDPAEPGHCRRRGRLGRPGRDAPRSLPDAHRPRRPAVRSAQPVVQPRARADRADRAAAGLLARMGRRVRGLPRRPCRPGQAAALRAGADGVHRRLPVQFDPHHAADLADHAAGDHRRDGGAAAHRHAVRVHGPAWGARPGRRADQEPDRRPEQDPHRDRHRARRPIRRSWTAAPARCGRCAWS